MGFIKFTGGMAAGTGIAYVPLHALMCTCSACVCWPWALAAGGAMGVAYLFSD
jgi:hypothetical protein